MGADSTDSMKQCLKLLKEFMNMQDAGPFIEPVDWKSWGLYDYPQIIKHPMDLTTVKTKLKTGVYKTTLEFAKDMRLIWSNCMLYNQDGSEFHSLASEMSMKFEERLKLIRTDGDVDEEDDDTRRADDIKSPTLDDKTEFSQNIYKLSSEELGQVVDMLDSKCPRCLDKEVAMDEVEISIDAIDKETFRFVDSFVKDCMPKHKETTKSGSTSKSSKKSKKKKKSSDDGTKSKKQKI